MFKALSVSGVAQLLPSPVGLRTNLLLHSEKGIISHTKPSFLWQTDSSIKKITAFRLLVSSSLTLLENNNPDYWDSKKVLTNNNQATYNGKDLVPGKKYFWKVQIWNEKRNPSPYAKTVSFQISEKILKDTISHYPLTFEWQKAVKIIPKQKGEYFLDFGKDAFAQLQLHLNCEKNDTVIIEAGEMMENEYTVSKNPSRNIRYIQIKLPVIKGEHDYSLIWPKNDKRDSHNPIQMPEYIGEVFPFRFVAIKNLSGNLDESSIQRKMVFYPFDENASSFVSSDTVLNQVWDLCKYSIKATSFAGFYLDGDRERLPYEGDAVINQLSHYAVDAEYSMARRTMAYLLFHPTWPTEWSLQNCILAWNDYMYTGDNSFIKKYYAELKIKTLMPLTGSNGLISTRSDKQTDSFLITLHKLDFDNRHGLVDITDWPQSGFIGDEKEYGGETDGFVFTKYNAIINAYYYNALVLMQKIASVLHNTKDVDLFTTKAKQVWQSYQTVFADEASGLIKDGDETNHTSLHSNLFALDFGLVPEKNVPNIISYIKSRRMACSVYGSQFLLNALYDYGEGQYGLELMTAKTQRSWYNMIRYGSTITMEAWDKVYKPNLDLNHAWGSAPANIIIKKLMGVEPLTPGFETIRIKPSIGSLTFAKMKTTTIKGEVAVSFQKSSAGQIWDIQIPGATTATLYLPKMGNNKSVCLDGKLMSLQSEKKYWVIETVIAGKHTIEIK